MSRHFSRSSEPKRKLSASNVYREVKELLWPRRWILMMGFVLITINRAAGMVLPGSTKYLMDDVVIRRQTGLLLPLAAAVGGAVVVQAITSFFLVQLLSTSAQKLIAEMRVRVQRHIGQLPVRYYDANKTGALVSRVMWDVEGLRNLVGTGLVDLAGGLLTAVFAFVMLMRLNAAMTLIALAFMLLFGLVLLVSIRKVRPMHRERSKINAELTGRLTETFGGVRVVKGFRAEERESAVFSAGAFRLFEQIRKTLLAQSTIGFASTLLMGLVSVTVMIVGGRMMTGGQMTIGGFVAYTAYMGFMVAPIFQIVGIGNQLTEAFAGLDRVREVFSEQPEDDDPERTQSLGSVRGHVVFENVSFEYDPGKPVLYDISLEAVPGTVTALVGPSGSGKSTLTALVAAFARPTLGRIFIDGIDLSTVRLESFRSQLGVVLQDNFLFDGTIKENILFGRPDAADQEVLRAAKLARVDEFAERFDARYDTIVGERGVKLSGGQRQRVAIARAVLASPRVLILDEATSSLDTESESFIQEGLAALMKGRTSFVIAHRMSTIRGADQILVLEDGRIIERGKHTELLRLRGRYFDLYTKQAGIEANRFLNPGEEALVGEGERSDQFSIPNSQFSSEGNPVEEPTGTGI